jgi:hypothetical protein
MKLLGLLIRLLGAVLLAAHARAHEEPTSLHVNCKHLDLAAHEAAP